MKESRINQKEPQEFVMTESQVVGKIRSIADGKDGITALARSVRSLDEKVEALREKILAHEKDIDDMRRKYGALGEMLGPIEALFKGKLEALEKAKGEFASLGAEMQEKSIRVYNGMCAIEEMVDAYVKGDRRVKAAEAVRGFLEKMSMFTVLCTHAMQSIAKNRGTGNQEEIAQALQLVSRNASLFRNALNEYGEHIKKAPQWSGDVDTTLAAMADVDMIRAAHVQVARNITMLQEKMAGYTLQKKAKVPGASFTNEDKEYFKQRATLHDDNQDVSENNP